MASDWSIVDSGTARLLAWDTCCDRFAILESAIPPRLPVFPKGSSSKRAREAAAVASSASVQVCILLYDGTSNILMRSVGTYSEPAVCCFNPPSFSLITPFYPLLCFLCHRRTFYFFRHDHSSNPSQETGSLRSAANWVNSPWKLFWSHQELGCTSEIERQRTRSWNSCLKIFGRH
ncbi:uncharacterized protein LOC127745633 [Arachis duranensis]|uniref:Uncharacterized protein LOC127745633 n=1 Tax=Arachis duranensis TaxID=130453 RepID=A0A9C6TDM8_ARADU|nr:uncharacterized protein LOC127745633 [Arachis duranensis]